MDVQRLAIDKVGYKGYNVFSKYNWEEKVWSLL
jgi:hypothetical protein